MPKRVLHFQKHHEASALWNRLPTDFGAEEYRLVSIDRTHIAALPQEDAETVMYILDELQWFDSVLIAHGADCRLACALAALVAPRISALFLVDAPDDVHHIGQLTTCLHVATAAGDRQDPFVLENLNWLPEVFHAFCTLKLPS